MRVMREYPQKGADQVRAFTQNAGAFLRNQLFPVAEIVRDLTFIPKHDIKAARYMAFSVVIAIIMGLLFGLHLALLLAPLIPLGLFYLFGQMLGYTGVAFLLYLAYQRRRVEVWRIFPEQKFVLKTYESLRLWWHYRDVFTMVQDNDNSRDVFVNYENVNLGRASMPPPYSLEVLKEADALFPDGRFNLKPFDPQSFLPERVTSSNLVFENDDVWEIPELLGKEVKSNLGAAIGTFATVLMVLGGIMGFLVLDTVRGG